MVINIESHNWSIFREEILEYSEVNRPISYSSRLGNLCERRNRKILRTRGGRWLQRNSIYQTQQGRCEYEFKKTVAACRKICMSLSQIKITELRRETEHRIPYLANEIFMIDSFRERKNLFPSMMWHWVY